MQKKNEKGITLVALIITIIVMLILATVSVRTIVGDNGILNSAQNAKTETEWAEIIEEIDYMLLEYNVDDEDITISGFLNNKVTDGEIEKFFAYPNDDGTYTIIIQIDGYTVVTKEDFDEDTGTLTYDLGEDESTTVLFMDNITAGLNFDIVSGEVTVYITQDMKLTNEGMSRSAIDVHDGATFNLYIGKDITMTVDSGYGTNAERSDGTPAEPGAGGYAGIHVPEGATLNLYGAGTLIAYGGDAGEGSDALSADIGGSGGGGAGAGIGGHGGTGGVGSFDNATDGENGESAGEINIYNSLTVYAYGGAGGSGGAYLSDSYTSRNWWWRISRCRYRSAEEPVEVVQTI